TDPREDARLRFLDEGRILANLKSPHLVQVLAVGTVNPDDLGTPFMALELLPGRSLEQRLRQEGPLPWRQVAELLGQVASALADMHHVGVIHRDIKPGNLVEVGSMTRRRLVKVVDLGIAKVNDWTIVDTTGLTPSPRHQTEANFVVGTPGFLAPEVSLVPANPRFDTFALGVTLYVLCTGVMPTLVDLRPMNEVCPGCDAPPELEALVASALAVIVDDRIATAEEFGQRLAAIRAAHADESEPYLFAGCFELLQPLGVGAKGEVYRAYNHDALAYVALKLLSEKSKANPEERARFAREAQVLSAVRHPALPELHECRTSAKNPSPYIAMALARGRRAGEFCINTNLLPVDEVLEVGKSLAGALAALHARGIIHRDVHAANVMIDREPKKTTAMLIDVGMAELEDKFFAVVEQRYPPRPEERVKLGTGGLERLDWTAPEARASRAWTAKSDVWSLGLLLHKLVTGKRPTTDATGLLRSPREFQPRCSHSLASAVLAALNPDPDERVDAGELLELLDLAADELAEGTGDEDRADASSSKISAAPEPEMPGPARPPRTPPQEARPSSPIAAPMAAPASHSPRRHRARVGAGLGVLAAVVLLALVWRGGGDDTAELVAVESSTSLASPPSAGATQAAVVTTSPAPPPSKHAQMLASSDPPRVTMRAALENVAADLRRCSALVGGLLVVEFTTAEQRDRFATVTVTSRTSAEVDRCVGEATAAIRFQPPQEPQLFTEEYTP
ncbi:MAG: serine/threonine protein kinase, partial [Myxococcales bacterium]|nr:serine/threonine protein kinase [Myxococcales bacterium]